MGTVLCHGSDQDEDGAFAHTKKSKGKEYFLGGFLSKKKLGSSRKCISNIAADIFR